MFNANNFTNCLFLNPMHEHLEVESAWMQMYSLFLLRAPRNHIK